jgi:hypothetical protein
MDGSANWPATPLCGTCSGIRRLQGKTKKKEELAQERILRLNEFQKRTQKRNDVTLEAADFLFSVEVTGSST